MKISKPAVVRRIVAVDDDDAPVVVRRVVPVQEELELAPKSSGVRVVRKAEDYHGVKIKKKTGDYKGVRIVKFAPHDMFIEEKDFEDTISDSENYAVLMATPQGARYQVHEGFRLKLRWRKYHIYKSQLPDFSTAGLKPKAAEAIDRERRDYFENRERLNKLGWSVVRMRDKTFFEIQLVNRRRHREGAATLNAKMGWK